LVEVTQAIDMLIGLIDRVKWRYSNGHRSSDIAHRSRYEWRFVWHDVALCEVNWWRFVTFLNTTESVGYRQA